MNYKKLLYYAELSKESYLSSDISDDDRGSSAIIREDGNDLIIAFRGTELKDKKDILTDINFFPKLNSYGICHRGFYKAFKSLRSEIRDIVQENEGRRIILTGHSLGAAMATVTPLFIDYRNFEVYTFGVPKSMRLFKEYPNRLFNVVNDNDLVSKAGLILYKHYGTTLHLANSIHDLAGMIKYKGISLDGLSDHSIESYIEVIKTTFID